MKSILSMFLMLMVIVSCSDKEKTEKSSIDTNSLTGKWWTVKCMAIDQSSGYVSMVGGLDYGRFYFSSAGIWTRMADEAQLAICNPVDSMHTFIINSGSGTGGWGIPFGEFYNLYDSSWNISGTTIIIKNWGNWRVLDQEVSEISFTSSRTNYLYHYTLVAE